MSSKSRHIDWMILAMVAVQFCRGYLTDRRYSSHFFLNDSSLLLVSFAAFYFPFRKHTRAIWIVAAPLAVMVVPVLGRAVYERLRYAEPGVEFAPLDAGQIIAGYVVTVAMIFGWSVLALITRVRMERVCAETKRRYVSLAELTAFTGIFCLTLLLCKEHLLPSNFNLPRIRELTELSVVVVWQFAAYGICFCSILYCKPRNAATTTIVCYLIPISICMWALVHRSHNVIIWHRYLVPLLFHMCQVTIAVVAGFSLRSAGIRLQRPDVVPGASVLS